MRVIVLILALLPVVALATEDKEAKAKIQQIEARLSKAEELKQEQSRLHDEIKRLYFS